MKSADRQELHSQRILQAHLSNWKIRYLLQQNLLSTNYCSSCRVDSSHLWVNIRWYKRMILKKKKPCKSKESGNYIQYIPRLYVYFHVIFSACCFCWCLENPRQKIPPRPNHASAHRRFFLSFSTSTETAKTHPARQECLGRRKHTVIYTPWNQHGSWK